MSALALCPAGFNHRSDVGCFPCILTQKHTFKNLRGFSECPPRTTVSSKDNIWNYLKKIIYLHCETREYSNDPSTYPMEWIKNKQTKPLSLPLNEGSQVDLLRHSSDFQIWEVSMGIIKIPIILVSSTFKHKLCWECIWPFLCQTFLLCKMKAKIYKDWVDSQWYNICMYRQ